MYKWKSYQRVILIPLFFLAVLLSLMLAQSFGLVSMVNAGSNIDFGRLPENPASVNYIAWIVESDPPRQIITENSYNPSAGTGNGYADSLWALNANQFNQPSINHNATINMLFGGEGADNGSAWSYEFTYDNEVTVTDHELVGESLTDGNCPQPTNAEYDIEDDRVILTWSGDAVVYHVYRSINASGAENGASNGIYNLVDSAFNNGTGIVGNQFIDDNLNSGAGLWYVVVPGDGDGNLVGCGSAEMIASADPVTHNATETPTETSTETSTESTTATSTIAVVLSTITATPAQTPIATSTPTSVASQTPDQTSEVVSSGDEDDDGVSNSVECPQGPPFDASQCPDTDDDETPDYLDPDDDGDGVGTRHERPDTTGDGEPNDLDTDFFCQVAEEDCPAHPNYLDADDDNDGIPTSQENPDPNGDGNPEDAQDTDGDEMPDYLDDDDDGDGRVTSEEEPPTQNSDGDELPDYLDNDDDNDGVLSLYEEPGGCKLDFCLVSRDFDQDRIPDYLDDDDDNDGLATSNENADPNGDGNPDDAQDTDEDDLPDYLDIDGMDRDYEDDDNDGVSNSYECPAGPPFDSTRCPDNDYDGSPDFADDDDDNDGILTRNEGSVQNNDGNPDDALDSDEDGLPNYLEPNYLDTDGDGATNPNDPDDDGDGRPTAQECPNRTCPDNDRDRIQAHLDPDDVSTSFSGGDSDNDEISDTDECPGGFPCLDSDNDGQPDYMTSSESRFSFELEIENEEADTSGQAVETAPGIMLRFEYKVINSGNTDLNWRKLEDNQEDLNELCELPRLVPARGSVTCLIERAAEDAPGGIEHVASVRVVSAVASASVGAVFMATERDSAWYQTDELASTIGDFVWEDLDQDGIQSEGEPGLPGVQVELYDLVGQVVDRVVTDSEGFYRFTGVESNTYRVGFVLPDATTLVFTRKDQTNDAGDSDANPSSGRSDPVTIQDGTNDQTIDAGITGLLSSKPSTLGDFVWEDINGNGLQETGEPALAGVTVQLLNSNDTVLQTTLTDSSGRYFFTPLMSDRYKVRFTLPNGYSFTRPNRDELDEDDSDAETFSGDGEGSWGDTESIDLGVSEIDTRWDAGLYRPIQLGNFVWEDQNGDGLQDEGEPGVGGVEIELYRAGEDGEPVETTTSDEDGSYSFIELAPGTYYIRVVPPATHTITERDQGADSLDSDVNPLTGISGQTTLPSGGKDETLDVGLIPQSTIGDFVWHDLDNNGLQDDDEPGVAGVVVELINSEGIVIDTAITDDNGQYLFAATPAVYTLTFKAPSGYRFVTPDAGNQDDIDSDVDPATGQVTDVNLESGMAERTIDAGLSRTDEVITIQATVNGIDPAEGEIQVLLGEPVRLVYTVTNLSNIPLEEVTVTDENGETVPGLTCAQTTVPAGGSVTCTVLVEAEEDLQIADVTVNATLEDGTTTTATKDTPIEITVIETGVDMSVSVSDSEDPLSAGEVIRYTLVYTNNSAVDATNVTIVETLPLGVLFNQFESVEPELALPTPSISPDGTMILVWDIPLVAAGTTGEIVFQADTDPNLGGTTIDNVVSIQSDTPESNPVDNSATEMTTFRLFGLGAFQPTALELLHFSAEPMADDGIFVRWVTAAEVDTSGFDLYRASSGKWEDAVQVTAGLINAAGAKGGEYSFTDFSITPNINYTYWLVETENDGSENRYGPVDSYLLQVVSLDNEEWELFLPLIAK